MGIRDKLHRTIFRTTKFFVYYDLFWFICRGGGHFNSDDAHMFRMSNISTGFVENFTHVV